MACEFQYNGPSTCSGSELPVYPGVLEKTSCEAGGIAPANVDFLLDSPRHPSAYNEVDATGSPGSLLINDSNGDTHGITIDNFGAFDDGFVANQTPPLIKLNAPGYITTSFQLTVSIAGFIGSTPIIYDPSLPEYVELDSNSLKWKIAVDSSGNLNPTENGETVFGWMNPENATGPCDCLFATCELGAGSKSRKLRLTDFDAGIPADAEIKAIAAVISAHGSTFARNGRIQVEAQLLKNGSPSGDRYTFSRNWGEGCLLNPDGVTADSGGILGTTAIRMALSSLIAQNPSTSWDDGQSAGCETKTAIGDETSAPCMDIFLWGGSWTAADLLDLGFGIEIQVFESSGGGAATAYLDCVEIVFQYAAATSFPALEAAGSGFSDLFADGAGEVPVFEAAASGFIDLFADGMGEIPALESQGAGFIDLFGDAAGELPALEMAATAIGEIFSSATLSLPALAASSGMGSSQEFILITQDPDWSEGVEESLGWLTDILTGYRSLEQRIQLRETPRMTVKLRFLFTTAGEASAFESNLWRLRALRVQLPFWPDAARLTASAEPSDTSLEFDPATRRFADGGLALLWRDSETSELLGIDAVTGSGLNLAGSVAGTWPADGHTFVLPVLVGRLEDAPELLRPTSTVAAVELTLITEGIAIAEPSWAESYAGFDVLPDEPDRGQDQSLIFERSLHHLDPGTGVTAAWDRAGVPVVHRQAHRLILDGREAIDRLRGFLARRRGRLVPFWWPSWQSDLQMSANLTANDPDLTIKEIGYADGPFLSPARRRLAFIPKAAEIYYREVLAAEDGAPGMEALTLDDGVPVALSKDRTLISYLPFLRLADDEIKFLWQNSHFAELTLDTLELPTEVELETGS